MLTVGESAHLVRSYSQDDLHAFAALSSASVKAVPEPLIAALFSQLLGMELPGFGTNYLKQELRFKTPAPLNTPLEARVEIIRLRPEKHLVDLCATCRTIDGRLICEGRSLVKAKDVPNAF
ncbi:(R)-specific enoyl-CoA hydratase [Tritonibacter multivorans]|uniref:(R)-specific enoyl-CoA hydratase n=1 Tax=Tritonibacter multivorans TaxID=928856 RepID=A0A0P1GGF5_9RHOB|nr:hypothetical protein [Tritonibacter multivorans]MDA7422189.1 phosphate acetyltransferase [Tritonibacter multivorans]CUH74772.1 (R)-specific enoyl-CoA hydratase [Tritonibacter multivorans]SFD69306.1 Acyl dehydratase [Tritonibacter multivorans]